MARRMRDTLRKRLIHQVIEDEYGGNPILLEELRWQVILRESTQKGRPIDEMTPARMKSFARTIREHCSYLKTVKIPRPDLAAAGFLARAAVYRIRSREILDSVLSESEVCVVFTITDNERCIVGCTICLGSPTPAAAIARILFPITSPLTVIYPGTPRNQALLETLRDFPKMAEVPWRLYRSKQMWWSAGFTSVLAHEKVRISRRGRDEEET